jgi:hypothetical protein
MRKTLNEGLIAWPHQEEAFQVKYHRKPLFFELAFFCFKLMPCGDLLIRGCEV